jgi:cytochrome oxidase Cu insertion factor (SCO1/SenC/PrrC family)
MARKASQTQIRKEALAKKQQRRRNLMIGGVLAVLVVITAVFTLTRQSDDGAAAGDLRTAPEVGALAPDFELAGINGETVRLSDFRGQPVAVTFMHTW